jgi:hypothetical protein
MFQIKTHVERRLKNVFTARSVLSNQQCMYKRINPQKIVGESRQSTLSQKFLRSGGVDSASWTPSGWRSAGQQIGEVTGILAH